MRIEDQRQQQRQAMQEQARGVYAALMRKRAESPDENLADETEQAALDEASVTLGYDDARRLADLDIVIQCVRRERQIAELEKELEPQTEARQVAQDYAVESRRLIDERQAEQTRLTNIVDIFSAKQGTLDRERGLLETLKREKWQLLAVPDPAVEARKLHLFIAVGTNGRPNGATYDSMPIEQVMLSPRGHRIAHRDILPMVGQTQKQVDALVSIHQQLLAAHDEWVGTRQHKAEMLQSESPRVNLPFGMYLMTGAQITALTSFASVAFTPSTAADLYAGEDADPIILTAPFQSKSEAAELRAEYDALVKKLRAKRHRYEASLRGEDNPEDQDPQSYPRRNVNRVLMG